MLWEIGVEGCEVRALRNRLELDSGHASRLLRALEEDGLVRIEPTPSDRRVRMARLTPEGLAERAVLDERSDDLAASILDSLDGAARHLARRINLAVVAKSDPGRIRNFARERGWRYLRLLSSRNNSYNRDYHAESPEGEQMPILNVFVRDGDRVRHTWASELMYAPRDEGEEARHVDSIWPIWNVLDVTPEGRGSESNFPAHHYD